MAKTGLYALLFALSMPLGAADATTALFERLEKGDCRPSSLTGKVWTITTGPVGTHGDLNWGDELVFEGAGRTEGFNNRSAFNVWKNGRQWRAAEGWTGACVRNGSLSLYVVTGKVALEGCLHELAFGRLDHDDGLGNRLEVVFEHAESKTACTSNHADAVRHPGHAHGDND
jgi:hypothetical protein